ncbi:hypothetical protein Harman_22850 [Haloarcula mannanilytica]|uniref:histidine kinase n=1 Tax=Haloarcula mannanilytica TaxID=2509225 RepID=A0A4C2ELX2_9EURY|nr:PAS domain S-box protein [Haloarcula mannanilytica]GCF14350.1 hypothetical protein Harman_22850 [Haloarcula mannanilytica]
MADQITVLHVDDEQGFAELTAEYLERIADDLTVVTETNPDHTLDRLDDSIDCVVSDYEMPERNGLELFHLVRNRYPDLPFILFTGRGNEAVASEAVSAGITDYLQKDSSTDQYTILANRIRNAVERRRAQQERRRSERRFEAVFQDPQVQVGVLDPDGTVRKVNETALTAIGRSREAVLGKFLWDVPWLPTDDESDVRARVERAANGEYVDFEIDHTRTASAERSMNGFIRPVRNNTGDVVSLVVSGQDVTARNEREEELERISNLLSRVQRLANVGGWELDISTGPPYTGTPTDEFYRIYGLSPGVELSVDDLLEFAHPSDRELVEESVEGLLEAGDPFDIEIRIETVDGEQRWVRSIGAPIERDGEIVKARGAIVDITDLKEQQAELERKTDFLRQTQRIANVGGWEIDISETPYDIEWTDQLYEIFEIPPQEPLTPERILDFVHPDDHDRVKAEIERLLETGTQLAFEYRIRSGKGNERWLRVVSEGTDDETDVLRGAVLDITPLKRATRELQQREAELSRYREFTNTILDTLDDVFVIFDDERQIRRWNESLVSVTGYSPADLGAMTVGDLVETPDQSVIERAFEGESTAVETTLVTADGTTIPYEFVVERVETPEGDVRIAAIGRDISTRKEHEETLARTNRQLQTILETTTALVFVKDSDGHYRRANERFREVFADDETDVVGKTDVELFPEEIAEQIRADDRTILETEESIEREEEVPTTDGLRTFLTLKNPIYDDEGNVTGICGVATDITERAEYKADIERQKERLDEFASIVSHDLRNPLDVAMGQVRLAKADPSEEHLSVIERSLDRMQELIDDLLTLARQGERVTEIRPVAIENAIEQAWRSVQTGETTLETDVSGSIMADPTRLQQLFENLIRNAVEHGSSATASEPQAEDVLSADSGQTQSGRPQATTSDTDLMVTVRTLDDGSGFYFADDGTGIPEDERESVFRSGYSTSDTGTGFGLAIVREIAEAHGWTVTTTESEGGGARFEFRGVDAAE